MKIKKSELLACGAAYGFLCACSLAVGRWVYLLNPVANDFRAIASLASAIVAFFALSIALTRTVTTLFPAKPGSQDGASQASFMLKFVGFLNIFNNTYLIHTELVPFFLRQFIYRALGCRVGRNVLMGGKIFDPHMVSIGDDVILGEDTLITCHVITGNSSQLAPVAIGDRVTIGGRAIICPGVTIGSNSVIGLGSLVLPGTQIPANEFWAGTPARRIRAVEGVTDHRFTLLMGDENEQSVS